MGLTTIQLPAESTPPVSITKADLSALVAGSTLVPYTTYIITDAQDALSGTVSVYATSINTLDTNGSWNFVAKLPAQGRFKLLTGAAGSVNQITVNMPTVGVTNLLTAPVPFNTTRNQTAVDVVANINANSGVSLCRAWVTQSTVSAGNLDTPIISIEALNTTTGFTHTMVVTLTTLTIGGQVNPTLGFTEESITLESKYDLTNDRILSAYDRTRDCLVDTSMGRITSIGMNSVTKYRWNDPRLISIKVIDSMWQDVAIRVTTASNIPRWRNVIFSNMLLQQVTFSTNQMLDATVTGDVSNFNSLTGLSIARSNCYLSISSIDVSSLSLDGNFGGSYTLSNITLGTAAVNTSLTITLNNTTLNINTIRGTSVSGSTISENTGSTISITNGSLTRMTVLNNTLLSTIDVITPVLSGLLNISKNIINAPLRLNALTVSGSTITIADNIINSDTSPYGLNIDTVTAVNLTIRNCKLTAVSFPTTQTWGSVAITYSEITKPILLTATSANDITITNSILNFASLAGLSGSSTPLTIVNSVLDDCFITTNVAVYFDAFNLDTCVIKNATIKPGEGAEAYHQVNLATTNIINCPDVRLSNNIIDSYLSITDSVIENCPLFQYGSYNDTTLGSGVASLTRCSAKHSTITITGLYDCVTTDLNLINTVFSSWDNLTTIGASYLTLTDVTATDSDIQIVGTGFLTITDCQFSKFNYSFSPSADASYINWIASDHSLSIAYFYDIGISGAFSSIDMVDQLPEGFNKESFMIHILSALVEATPGGTFNSGTGANSYFSALTSTMTVGDTIYRDDVPAGSIDYPNDPVFINNTSGNLTSGSFRILIKGSILPN